MCYLGQDNGDWVLNNDYKGLSADAPIAGSCVDYGKQQGDTCTSTSLLPQWGQDQSGQCINFAGEGLSGFGSDVDSNYVL